MARKNQPDWRDFEIAVAAFTKALNPQARVIHDARLPDKHTKSIRQRDVWVESPLGGIFDVKILISCKRLKRRINELDMDHFHGEFLSSGADIGVLYSYSGFNTLAIDKARRLNIRCCRLYRQEPPDLPEVLLIPNAYSCYPTVQFTVRQMNPTGRFTTWGEFFQTRIDIDRGSETGLEFVARHLSHGQSEAIRQGLGKKRPPLNWKVGLAVVDENLELRFDICQNWQIFRANIEAMLVDGTYELTHGAFAGTQTIPPIAVAGTMPGPEWVEIQRADVDPERPHSTFVLAWGDVEAALSETLSKRPLVGPHNHHKQN